MSNKINCPFFDRRVKLLPCQLERISAMYGEGMKIADIHRQFNQGNRSISRRTIEFLLFPDRLAMVRENSKKIAKSTDKELIKLRVNNTRNYYKKTDKLPY